jgi:hypothetical protein
MKIRNEYFEKWRYDWHTERWQGVVMNEEIEEIAGKLRAHYEDRPALTQEQIGELADLEEKLIVNTASEEEVQEYVRLKKLYGLDDPIGRSRRLFEILGSVDAGDYERMRDLVKFST